MLCGQNNPDTELCFVLLSGVQAFFISAQAIFISAASKYKNISIQVKLQKGK